MNKKRFYLILLLCFAMILPVFASCADPTNPDDDLGYNTNYYDNSSRERTSGNLPEDINLNGETVGIFYSSWLELDVEGEDETVDLVYTAIYERNEKVKNWLNVDLNFIMSDATSWSDISGEVTNLVLTFDDSVDIIIATSNSIIQERLYSLFLDLNNTLYLELDQPWWNYDAIYETSVDGRIFQFLYGDMLFSSITGCGAVYYNKELYAMLNPDKGADYLYQMVLDKTWTLEQFYYITQKCYLDKDGDTKRSDGDMYGYSLFRYAEPIHYFAVGCGVQYYERMKNGYPRITINNDRSVEFCELLEKVLYENNGAWLFFPNMVGQEVGHEDDFPNKKVVFLLTTLGSSLKENMREMESDYGIIPYPLWDEEDEYKTLLANGVALASVPYSIVTGNNYDRLEYIICPVLEAMSIESYRSVTLNFYEYALKGAYTRDDIAAQMIDIIVENSTKNFLYEYGSSLSSIGSIFSACMDKRIKFSTRYASIGEPAENALVKLITEYKETMG